MAYETRSFWWGFAAGAGGAYAFIFFIIFVIATAANLPIGDISLLLMVASAIFSLLVILGRVRNRGVGR